jgi:hypothetical protein
MMKKIFYTGFFIWIFLYILIYLKPEVHFFVQQPPFLNTISFFKEHLMYPGYPGRYLSDWVMQGFYNNWLGSVIILIFAILLSFLLFEILKKLKLNISPLILIFPFAMAIMLFNDYYFPFEIIIKSVFVFISVFLFSKIAHQPGKALTGSVILYLLIYYIFGSGSALVFSLSVLLILYLVLPLLKFLKQGGIVILLSALLPFLMFTFIFNLSYKQAYFLFFPEVPITLRYNHSTLLYAFEFLLPGLILLVFLFNRIGNLKFSPALKLRDFGKKLTDLVRQLIVFFLLFIIMHGLIRLAKNEHKRNITLCDYYSNTGNWDKVTEIALSDSEYDIGINMDYNMAIDNTGKFLQDFFNYPQLLGVTSIFPDNIKTPVYAMHTSDFYLDINYVSKSQHWAYALLTLEPYNARVMKRLVVTNLILGNYKASQTYLNVLSHNRLNLAFVNQYQPFILDTTKIANDPYFSEKRKFNPTNFAVPVNIKDRFLDLIARDSTNRQAYEHLQICYMLQHDLWIFMNNFEQSVKFYNQIPQVYEQALILYLYSTGTNKSRIKISENTKNQFELFLKTMKQYKNDKDVAKSYLGGLKNTYFYYVTYLSPKVTNVKIETTKY